VAVATAGPYANHLHLAPTDNHASTSPLSFYRPDALPAAQPTALQVQVHQQFITDLPCTCLVKSMQLG